MFSLIIGSDEEQYYFNFNGDVDHLGIRAPAEYILSPLEVLEHICPVLYSDKLWFLHNAKYDMRRLNMYRDISLAGQVHCTQTVDRILRNDHMHYSLDAVAKRRGYLKDSAVEEYVSKHKLYTQVDIPGKSTKEKQKHYDLVPFDLMAKYGCNDVKITYQIGMDQLRELGL